MSNFIRLAAVVSLGLGGEVLAGDVLDGDAEVERACSKVAAVDFPSTDRPSVEEERALKGCESETLYYGIGMPADLLRARACAFLELDAGRNLGLSGAGILMMVYANGKGVPRNLDVAMATVCRRMDQGRYEKEARVRHLQSMRDHPSEIDVCDDITSGLMHGACTAHADRVHAIERGRRLSVAVANVPAAARKDFTALEAAARRFFDARVKNEVDLSGTSRAAFSIAERSALDDGFVDLLEKAGEGKAPAASARELAESQAKLDAVYAKLMKGPGPDDFWGTVTRDGIRATQLEWLRYRDAWVIFGRRLLPRSSKEGWSNLLTKQRVEMLAEFEPR